MVKLYSFLIIILSLTSLSRAYVNNLNVPPTRLDFRRQFQSQDFVFDLLGSPNVASGTGGEQQIVFVKNMPALSGLGLTAGINTIEPCGINLPHSHPRADELLYLIEGDYLQTGFIEENDGRTIINNIYKGGVI